MFLKWLSDWEICLKFLELFLPEVTRPWTARRAPSFGHGCDKRRVINNIRNDNARWEGYFPMGVPRKDTRQGGEKWNYFRDLLINSIMLLLATKALILSPPLQTFRISMSTVLVLWLVPGLPSLSHGRILFHIVCSSPPPQLRVPCHSQGEWKEWADGLLCLIMFSKKLKILSGNGYNRGITFRFSWAGKVKNESPWDFWEAHQ